MNKAILVGRLTRDPELRMTNSNIPLCRFTIAVDRRFTSASGEREADFINCIAWRKTAEFINNYFFKGKRIGVVGHIQVSSWTDDQNATRYRTEVVVDEAEFVDDKRPREDGSDRGPAPMDSQKNARLSQGFDDGQDLSNDAFEIMDDSGDAALPFDY